MSTRSSYKKQQRLSFLQFLSEIPDFILLLISAIFSRSLLVVVDLFDSFGELLRSFITSLLSKKLSKDLRFEYNYGTGKIEAISALLCEGIIFLGVLLVLGLSVYELIFPAKPSDFLIFVVGLKVIHVSLDVFFLIKQRNIRKAYNGAIVRANYVAAIASLLFDCAALVSLLTVWLFRDNPISGYITPIISIVISLYLLVGCIIRNKIAIDEITDKTLPEDVQLKLLSIITQFYPRCSEFHDLKSKMSGGCMIVDLHLSFTEDTAFKDIALLRRDIHTKLNELFDECEVNIVIGAAKEDNK